MARRRERRWESGPVMASVLLHGAVAALLAFSGGKAPEPPKTKIYAVDIVSPPPNVAGAPPTEALSNQEPGPAASPGAAPAAETPPAAAPDPAPPAPEPPAPEPDPAPPKAEPKAEPKEPAKAPEPRRTPPERPAPTPPRPSTPRPPTPAPEKNRPTPTPPANRPAANRPAATPEKNRPAATNPGTNRPATNRPAATPEKNRPGSGSSSTGGSGTGSTRTRGDGTSTAPATGSNPQANSPGGEGLNIHQEGDPCPVAGYCDRVQVTVIRFFRPPPGAATARGEVCFRILRDGTVADDITTQNLRGGAGAAFRLAMMEAAEAAGSRRAFGTLPGAFDPQRWKWCVELSPR